MTNTTSTKEVTQEIEWLDAQKKLATIKTPEMVKKAEEELTFELGYTELSLTGETTEG